MSESTMPEDQGQAMILGEMRGQLREVVHSMNNLSAKFDGLSREVIGLGAMAGDLVDMKSRIKIIEEKLNRQDGRDNAFAAIMRSPALGWLVGAAITAWVILTNKVHI